jgi:hypothetical protein
MHNFITKPDTPVAAVAEYFNAIIETLVIIPIFFCM